MKRVSAGRSKAGREWRQGSGEGRNERWDIRSRPFAALQAEAVKVSSAAMNRSSVVQVASTTGLLFQVPWAFGLDKAGGKPQDLSDPD